MKLKAKFRRSSLFAVLLISAIACSSHKPDVKEFPKSANAKEEIFNLDSAIANSKSQNYELLAPDSYQEAKESLEKARSMEKNDESRDSVLSEVAKGQAYMERAQKNADKNREKMQDILAARDEALTAKADVLLPNELTALDKKVEKETAKLENDDKNKLKEKRAEFITGYRDLELAAVKRHYLGESKFLIDEAIKDGAQDVTPKTLATAKKDYKAADDFITQNRHDTSEIEALTATSIDSSRKLESTLATARGLKAATPEETALKMQAEEERMNHTQDALAAEMGTNMALTASNSKMAKQKEVEAIYEEARQKFSPEEAEVYKQGDKLVIRLRSLEFPKSKAVLKGSDFALLKKVEDVIESFDRSNVVVQGHTDSTGGKQLNEKLSTERAKAVKQYLEANAPSDKVAEFDSEGFGYDRPLASNKTAEGRAQNRRVDVVIEPVQI